jgi:hypothetical protein
MLNICVQEQAKPPAGIQQNALQQLNYVTLHISHLIPEDSDSKKYNFIMCFEAESLASQPVRMAQIKHA